MFFPLIPFLRKYGNIVLWEIRGMGVSNKYKSYDIPPKNITEFYTTPIAKMLDFYNHQNIVMINHSLSCYISLRYLLKNKSENRIKKLIMLSPVGITPKENDLKNKIRSCKDVWETFIGNFGWKFNLTYKSPLRTICSCLKKKLLTGAFSEYSFN